MNEQTKNFLENEAQRIRKSVRNMGDTLEKREADDSVDDSQIEGMHTLHNQLETQLRFIEFLQDRSETLQDVIDICRVYTELAGDMHTEIARPENTEDWHNTLKDKHFLTALIDRTHLEIGNFTPPETESASEGTPLVDNDSDMPLGNRAMPN